MAAAIGMPILAPGADKNWVWSTEPFAQGAFGEIAGNVALKVSRLDLPAPISIRQFRASLRFASHEIAIDDMAGDLAGGRFSGSVVYKDTDTGLTANAKLQIAGSDASVLRRIESDILNLRSGMSMSARTPMSGG